MCACKAWLLMRWRVRSMYGKSFETSSTEVWSLMVSRGAGMCKRKLAPNRVIGLSRFGRCDCQRICIEALLLQTSIGGGCLIGGLAGLWSYSKDVEISHLCHGSVLLLGGICHHFLGRRSNCGRFHGRVGLFHRGATSVVSDVSVDLSSICARV